MIIKNKNRQRGAVSAIIVYVLLAIVGGMLISSQLMSGASLSGNNQKSDHLQALFLAESALDREINALNTDSAACGSLAVNQQSFAGGTFETVSSTVLVADSQCSVKVKGIKNSVVTNIEATLINQGGASAGVGAAMHSEHFPISFLSDWPFTHSSSEGTSGWDVLNCAGCVGSPFGGSLKLTTTTAGGWNSLIGYREQLLPAAINTTGGGITVDFSIGYRKKVTGTGNTGGVRQRIYLELYDSTNGVSEELWRDIAVSNADVWVSIPMTTTGLTNGRIYDYLRISYDMRGRAGRVPEVWIDEINITPGGAEPNWYTQIWDEVNQ